MTRFACAVFCALSLAVPELGAQEMSLGQARERAQERHETWKITQARISQAQEDVDLAWAGLVPTITAGASVTRNPEEVVLGDNVIQPLYVWDLSTQGTLRLFDPAQWAVISGARAALDGQRADAQWQRQQLDLEVTRAWFMLLATQEQASALDEILEIRQQEVTRIEALLGAARAVPLDLERAKAEALATKQRTIEARAALGNASDALAVLVVAPLDVPLRAAPGGPVEEIELAAAQPENLAQRADFQATTKAIEAAQQQESATERRWLPTIDLSAGASAGPPALTRPNGTFWSVTLGLTWVVLDGGRRVHLADQQAARTEELRQMQALQLRQEQATLRSARRDFDAAEQNRSVLEAREDNAQGALKNARARYQAGLSSALEVREATQALLEAKIARINNTLQMQMAWARYQTLASF